MEKNKKSIKRSSLGRGIESLIPTETAREISESSLTIENISQDKSRRVEQIDLDKITENSYQPRSYFDEEKLKELAESIKNYGVLEPILVTKVKEDSYSIVAGERRFRASQLAKMKTISAIVLTLTDEEKIEIAIVENLQREDLNPIEIALSFKDMMSISKITQEDLAKKLSISRPVVSNYIRLLTLSDEIQQAIKEKKISQSHARLLLSIDGKEKRNKLFQEILNENISVKTLEKKITKKKKTKDLSNAMSIYEQKLIEFFGTKVSISGSIKRGNIIINYFNDDDFSRIINLLNVDLD